VKATGMWNVLPLTVPESNTMQQFKLNLKKWLKAGQICEHNWLIWVLLNNVRR